MEKAEIWGNIAILKQWREEVWYLFMYDVA